VWSANGGAQTDTICECYSSVKQKDALDTNYLRCLEMHRKAVEKQNDEAMKLMRSGDRQGVEQIKMKAEEWKDCFSPEMDEINSELVIQFKNNLGKEIEIFFDIDFTAFNKFNETAYLKIDFANYDRATTWERPENAFVGSIYLVKNDSLNSPANFSPKIYPVHIAGKELDEYFYVNYNYLDYKHNGGFHKAMPRETSTLEIKSNNGRYLELTFTHISEEGDVLKGTFQCVYPFTQFD
jgi:hypothetical protein